MRDRNLFHLVNTIGNIFTRENITNGVHPMKSLKFRSFTDKKNKYPLCNESTI